MCTICANLGTKVLRWFSWCNCCCNSSSTLTVPCISLSLSIERLHRPAFVQELKNLETIEGDKVSFECLVEGKPLPEITWYDYRYWRERNVGCRVHSMLKSVFITNIKHSIIMTAISAQNQRNWFYIGPNNSIIAMTIIPKDNNVYIVK